MLQKLLAAAQDFTAGLSQVGLKDQVTVALTAEDGQRLAALIEDTKIVRVPLDVESSELLCAATIAEVTFTWVVPGAEPA